ncbi:MAG TPA: hypothetical protein ENN19_15035 [Chloroflexi bacterium]|nr:hypothetical protein [Chloroflexota bacterium]
MDRNLEKLRMVKAVHEAALMSKANVVSVAIGLRQRGGVFTSEPAIVVSVTHKIPRSELSPEDVIPNTLGGVPVDVQAVGEIQAL